MEASLTSGLIHRANIFLAGGKILCLAAASALLVAVSPAHAVGTVAGTDIVNVAQASYDDGGGGTITVDSNPVTITVDELLDVTVDSVDAGDVPVNPGATSQVLTFQVTNTGNGNEDFTLSADTARTGDDFDTVFEQIVLDTNDNGVYDPGVDTIYTPGTNDPSLAADESITVFLLSEIPAAANDTERAEVELSAVAVTGSGTPGTTFAGQGDGGGDAVVGSTGADAGDSGFFVVQVADVALVKSATIVDPFGGTEAVPGATITYQLVVTTSGTGILNNLSIADDIPNDTTYVTESITLEGGAVTDSGADADEGSFDGTQIAVALGNVSGGQTRTITFQVTID
ncbi:MAG: hypothetical protein AAGE37_07785 [Pseudomonadota bacterium]